MEVARKRHGIWRTSGTQPGTLSAVDGARRQLLSSSEYSFERLTGDQLVDAARRCPTQTSVGVCGWAAAELASLPGEMAGGIAEALNVAAQRGRMAAQTMVNVMILLGKAGGG